MPVRSALPSNMGQEGEQDTSHGVWRRGWQYVTQSVNIRGVKDFVSLYVHTCYPKKHGRSTPGGTGVPLQQGTCDDGLSATPILPDIETSDLRNIDWIQLKETGGYKGVVFDKDHTLTLPYDVTVHPFAKESLERCIDVFGKDYVVLYSNSAGLKQYDADGRHAMMLEEALGIPVLRHSDKKPYVSSRTVKELEDYFGCETHRLIMVGDRYMTDVVFGNRLGMLTIRPTPFPEVAGSRHRDPVAVRLSRRLEEGLVTRCRAQGMRTQKTMT